MGRAVEDLEQVARRFRALSDETRLRIVERLRDGEECVCNLTGTLDTGQSLLSFHLRILRDAGIVHARRAGRWVYYSLAPEAMDELGRFLKAANAPATGESQRGCR